MDLWIIVFVFLVLALIAGILLWVFWPTRAQPGEAIVSGPGNAVGFLSPCTVGTCGFGLSCDAGFCKRMIGQPCTILSDCVSGATACSGGICISGAIGGLNQPPPCNSGLAPNSQGICKGDEGFNCSSNADCITFRCQGTCQPFRSLGETCLANQCGSGLTCSLGYCQTSGITTGRSGSYCGSSGDQPKCDSDLTCINNTCMTATQNFLESCGTSSFCREPLICRNSLCRFPIPNNTCSLNNFCSSGTTCISNRCRSTPNLTCNTTDDCSSGICNGPALYSFSNNSWSYEVDIPEGVEFSRIESRTVNGSQSIWGLSTQSDNDLSGIYYWISGSSWIKSHMLQDNSGIIRDFSISRDGTIIVLIRDGNTSIVKSGIVNQDGSLSLTPWNTTTGEQTSNGSPIIEVYAIDVFNDSSLVISLSSGFNIYTGTEQIDFQPIVTASFPPLSRIYGIENTSALDNVVYIGFPNNIRFTGPGSSIDIPFTLEETIVSLDMYSDRNSGFQDTLIFITTESNGVYVISGGLKEQIPGYFSSVSVSTITNNRVIYSVTNKCIS